MGLIDFFKFRTNKYVVAYLGELKYISTKEHAFFYKIVNDKTWTSKFELYIHAIEPKVNGRQIQVFQEVKEGWNEILTEVSHRHGSVIDPLQLKPVRMIIHDLEEDYLAEIHFATGEHEIAAEWRNGSISEVRGI